MTVIPCRGRGVAVALVGLVAGAAITGLLAAGGAKAITKLCPILQGDSANIGFSGRPHSYAVPPGVRRMAVTIWGARGGMYSFTNGGGRGGALSAILNVRPGECLTTFVGQYGYKGGGWGWARGGYHGIASGSSFASSGAGGGGASALMHGSTVLFVAGGGGGGGGDGFAAEDVGGGRGGAGGSPAQAGGRGHPFTGNGLNGGQGGAGGAARQPNGTNGENGDPEGGGAGGGGGGGYNGGLGGHSGNGLVVSGAGGGGGGGGSNYFNAKLGESQINNFVSPGVCLVDKPVYPGCNGVIRLSW